MAPRDINTLFGSNYFFMIRHAHSSNQAHTGTTLSILVIMVFEELSWIHVLGGKSLPAATYRILPNLKKKKCHSFKTDAFRLLFPLRLLISSSLCTPAANCFFIVQHAHFSDEAHTTSSILVIIFFGSRKAFLGIVYHSAGAVPQKVIRFCCIVKYCYSTRI